MTQDELTEWTTGKIIDNYLEIIRTNGDIEQFSFSKWIPIEEYAKLKAELAEWKETAKAADEYWKKAIEEQIRYRNAKLAEKEQEIEQIRTLKDTYIKDLAESISKARVQDLFNYWYKHREKVTFGELLNSSGKEVKK